MSFIELQSYFNNLIDKCIIQREIMKKNSIVICLCIVLLETSSAVRHKQQPMKHPNYKKQNQLSVSHQKNQFKNRGIPKQKIPGIVPAIVATGTIATASINAPLDLSTKDVTPVVGLVAAPDVPVATLQANIRSKGYSIKQRHQINRADTMKKLHVLTELFTQGTKVKKVSVDLQELSKAFEMPEKQRTNNPIQRRYIIQSANNAINNIDDNSKKRIQLDYKKGEKILTLTLLEEE